MSETSLAPEVAQSEVILVGDENAIIPDVAPVAEEKAPEKKNAPAQEAIAKEAPAEEKKSKKDKKKDKKKSKKGKKKDKKKDKKKAKKRQEKG